ncbi:hypothetical protein NSZ01_14040 [Nocardioides szechwanensis]|uniref:Uncharacterized protein n=1 Tax=Nocardioides szechwanensis TaxID=1005944 RepID=A0A1H0BRC3_9ACTN|nr:hypothetical protein [Nocardioides szechwanensis]GEP33636.1 hypothetical protein NSZ01_14040 [Nocardioides szechwanensis]SDN48214.1 hypothetical protein SAMN05192576_2211 [Nocardioides szechwanensis]
MRSKLSYLRHGGEVSNLPVAGQNVDNVAQVLDLAGRPADTLNAPVSGRRPVRVEWVLRTGAGQTAGTHAA